MVTRYLIGNGDVSPTSAEGRPSQPAQPLSSHGRSLPRISANVDFTYILTPELEVLRSLKQKAIDAANKEDSGEGRLSSAYSASEAKARSAQVIPEHEDARLISPKSMKQAEILEAALEMTRLHYMSLTDEPPPSSPPLQNYMTQWRFLQDSLNAYWTRVRFSGEPPKLFLLGKWHGGLGNWKYLADEDFGDDVSYDGELFYGEEDGDYDPEPQGDMEVDGSYSMKNSLTYSATMGNQRVASPDDKVLYKARCGTQESSPSSISRSDPRGSDHYRIGGWGLRQVPYVNSVLSPLTIVAHEPAKGREATDTTAFHPDQRDWQEKGAGRPDLLRSFEKPQNFSDPTYSVGFMYFDGYLVVDHECQPLRAYQGLPLTLSSKLEGWRAEAIRRSDSRIRNMDLIARMPVKVEPSANGIPRREPVVKLNAVAGRQARFREQAGAVTWTRPTPRNVLDFLRSLLPQLCKDNNLALPRDLTQQERWQLRALNVGKRPDRARKVPNADKGMTREEYVDDVRKRAAGTPAPRDGNVRRRRKEATRMAKREATAESESMQTVASFSGVAEYPASPEPDHLHAAHQPSFAASPAPPADDAIISATAAVPTAATVPTMVTAPPTDTAPSSATLLLRALAPQVRVPLGPGPITPRYVRPGEYLLDESKIFLYLLITSFSLYPS
ncbi:hypothetical protein MMC07_005667 [Pseudocyphellaria aurata]|nr:hypothetical protein [Pseudocyphellaria aurata]